MLPSCLFLREVLPLNKIVDLAIKDPSVKDGLNFVVGKVFPLAVHDIINCQNRAHN